MLLTREEENMASGRKGPGIARCMEILIKFGEAFDAPKMVRLSSAHTMPKEPFELLEELTQGVEAIGTFTTLHPIMSAFNPEKWQKMGIPEWFGNKEVQVFRDREAIYRRIGFFPTYTCLPMLVGNLPRKGDFVSWIGSGAQLMVNSLIGARCNRDGTIVNLASAITGCAPDLGFFREENRYGELLVNLKGLSPERLSYADFGAIGYHVGTIAGNRNVVFDGLSRSIPFESLKYLMAPLSVSGSVSICHVVGVTPEATTLQEALRHKPPAETITVELNDIEATKGMYANNAAPVDMVVLGCPHCTLPELRRLTQLLDGKKLKNGKRLWIGTPCQMAVLAEYMGYINVIERAGGIITNSCMATIPEAPIPEDVHTVITNSFKAAHYISRLTAGRVKVCIADFEQCVRSVT
jgi:cis-L-3-hydroxyproline dehydratase